MKEAKTPSSGFTMQSLMDVMKENRDPRELLYSELGNKLFDIKNILMLTRFPNYEYMIKLIQNKIIVYFFHNYWHKVRAEIKLKPCEEYPYYKKTVKYYYPEKETIISDSYELILNDIMQGMIAIKGKGRDEIIEILDATDKKLSLIERGKNILSQ